MRPQPRNTQKRFGKSVRTGSFSAYVRAFTLTELLVVMGIITLLAAILLPALNRSIEQGRSLSCLNNLKQLQSAGQMYTDDNLGDLPPNNFVRSVAAGTAYKPPYVVDETSWAYDIAPFEESSQKLRTGVLFPYNQSLGIYRCPSDASTIRANGEDTGKLRWRSYNLNAWINCRSWVHTFQDPAPDGSGNIIPVTVMMTHVSEGEIRQPDRLFTFIDVQESAIYDPTFGLYDSDDANSDSPTSWLDLPADRHNRGANLAFADGHVEHWRWRSKKVFKAWGQIAASPNDLKDLTRLQSCVPKYSQFRNGQ